MILQLFIALVGMRRNKLCNFFMAPLWNFQKKKKKKYGSFVGTCQRAIFTPPSKLIVIAFYFVL